MKKSILLTICLALIGNTSFALDLFELGDCMKYGDRSPEDKRYYCFPMMKDLGEGELLYVLLFPLVLLSEKPQDAISSAQLTEMGYNADEIADFAKDMNSLQSAMIQRNLKFTSASEAKAWMRTLPLAPITREVMRLQ